MIKYYIKLLLLAMVNNGRYILRLEKINYLEWSCKLCMKRLPSFVNFSTGILILLGFDGAS